MVCVGGVVVAWQKWYPGTARGYRVNVETQILDSAGMAVTPAAAKLHQGIDPSTAPQEDLELLPGIGPALARRIMQSRDTLGPFHKPADLLRVPGIGQRSLVRLTPYLSFP